jgi:hypothetical protein
MLYSISGIERKQFMEAEGNMLSRDLPSFSSASNIPLACQPGALGAEEWERHQIVLKEMGKRVQGREELTDGYAFAFAADAYPLVAEFVARERLCCPFFHFVLDVQPASRPLWLRITGDGQEDVKAILEETMPGTAVGARRRLGRV